VSLLPVWVGVAGLAYLCVALVLGLVLLWLAGRFAAVRTDASARALFYGSLVYLPLVWAAMILDRST
jgi:heme O synthase-like polyprenyltransferase